MSVSIDLDKPRELQFDLKSIKELEASMNGLPLGVVIQQIGQASVTAITTALYVGLKRDDPALSLSLVTKKLETYLKDGGNLRPIAKGLSDAIEETGLFQTEEADAGNQKAAQTAAV